MALNIAGLLRVPSSFTEHFHSRRKMPQIRRKTVKRYGQLKDKKSEVFLCKQVANNKSFRRLCSESGISFSFKR